MVFEGTVQVKHEVHYSAHQWLRPDEPLLCLSGRIQHPDEKLLSDLIVEDKRRRKDVFSLEEELLTYEFLVREEWTGMCQLVVSVLAHDHCKHAYNPTSSDMELY